MSSTLNIEFQPFVSTRNYAPIRTFITKWDVEIENNRIKKLSRRRERDTKYFDYYEEYEYLPLGQVTESNDESDCGWELESNDGEGEDTHQGWLRSVEAENAYYDRKYGELNNNFEWYDMNQAELDTDQASPYKRHLDFEEHSLFKRVRV
jgi:hypothetical protein